MNAAQIRTLVEEKEPQLVALIDAVKAAGGRLVALQVGDVIVGNIENFWTVWEQAVIPEKVWSSKELRELTREISRSASEDRQALQTGRSARLRDERSKRGAVG